MDIVDDCIMQAVMRYYAQRPDLDVEGGLADQAVEAMTDPQAQYNLVFAHYLAGSISLARAAELLKLPWLDLRTRCLRLDVPLRTAPADMAEAEADAQVALTCAQS
jgi:predicted HTH domain antitoxin